MHCSLFSKENRYNMPLRTSKFWDQYRIQLTAGLLLAVLLLVSFWRVPQLGFVFDDAEYIVNNPHLTRNPGLKDIGWAFTTTYASFWHPLVWISYFFDVWLFSTNPKGFHVTNLIFHVMNTLLVFMLLWRVTGNVWKSVFVGALFGVHPLHVESVAWISQRKDVLSTFFWLLTTLAYVRYIELKKNSTKSSSMAYLATLFLFAMSLMAKPMLVTVPIILLLLDYWPLARFSQESRRTVHRGCAYDSATDRNTNHAVFHGWRLLCEKIPFFVLSLVFALVAYQAQEQGGAVSQTYGLDKRIGVSIVSYLGYIWKFLWPVSLCAHYRHPGESLPWWQIVVSGVLLAMTTLLLMRLRHTRPYLWVGWGFYVVTLLPVIGLVQLGTHAMADRYTYIPLLGLFVILAWGVPDLFPPCAEKAARQGSDVYRNRGNGVSVLPLCAIVTVVSLAISASFQTGYWRDNITLFKRVLSVCPNNPVALNNLGLKAEKQGHLLEAMQLYRRALDVEPRFAYAMLNLGHVFEVTGKLDDAECSYRRALMIKPDFAEALSNLGALLMKKQEPAEAVRYFERATRVAPSYVDGYYNLATAYVAIGDLDKAAEAFRRALKLNPYHADAHSNLGSVLMRQGKPEEAIEHFRQAVCLEPDAADVRYNLGVALYEMGDREGAAKEYAVALRLDPDYYQARVNLGSAMLAEGRVDEAERQFLQALESRTDLAEAYAGLAAVCYVRGDLEDARENLSLCRKFGGKPPPALVQALAGDASNQISQPR